MLKFMDLSKVFVFEVKRDKYFMCLQKYFEKGFLV